MHSVLDMSYGLDMCFAREILEYEGVYTKLKVGIFLKRSEIFDGIHCRLNEQIFRQTSNFFEGIRGCFEKISRWITGKYAILE